MCVRWLLCCESTEGVLIRELHLTRKIVTHGSYTRESIDYSKLFKAC